MGGLPRFYRQSGDPIIATYDFVDVAEGTGSVLFYGFTTGQSEIGVVGNSTYGLSTQAFRSATINTNSGDAAPHTTTFNFDSAQFNKPVIIKGTAFLSACIGHDNGTTTFISAALFKLNGSTETAISTLGISGAMLKAGTAAKTSLLKIPVTTTGLKQGEQIRLKLEMVRTDGDETHVCNLGHDPLNRDASSYISPSTNTSHTTQVKIYVPFQIDQ